VIARCRDNLNDGYRPILVTGQRGLTVAEGLADNAGLADRIDVPSPQPASRRAGIGAGASEVERVAQRRLVFVAAGPAHAGGGGGEREALAPDAGPGRGFAHDRIEPGERGAGEKGGFGLGFRRVDGAGPGRERRRGGGRGAWDGGRIGAREHAGRYPVAALLASRLG
jgi:hypothetical protein